MVVDGCIRKLIDDSTHELVNAVSLADKSGILPVAGGMIDQTLPFIAGMTIVLNYQGAMEKLLSDHG